MGEGKLLILQLMQNARDNGVGRLVFFCRPANDNVKKKFNTINVRLYRPEKKETKKRLKMCLLHNLARIKKTSTCPKGN